MTELVDLFVEVMITLVITGYIASIVIPYIQSKAQNQRAEADKRRQLIEETADFGSRYVASWRRAQTIQRAEIVASTPLTVEELNNKTGVLRNRSIHRDDLMATLEKSKIYFSTNVVGEIISFQKWDRDKADLGISEVPTFESWRDRIDKIVTSMKAEL